jgi:predicted transcriptional regulator of viral defense system
MVFDTLLQLVGDEPVFESALLLAGDVDPRLIQQQLSRWVHSGKIYKLRRGLYTLAPPYQKRKPHPFLVANYLQRGSYVSLQSALAHYSLIPEVTYVTTSVSHSRPERIETPLGVFEFRHVKRELLFGYELQDLGGQSAFIATPEKALLDLIYLQPGGDSEAYLAELRLQNLEQLNSERLQFYAKRFNMLKMRKAAERLVDLIEREKSMYEEV